MGTQDINVDIDETKKSFNIEGEGTEIEIPKDGSEEIAIDVEGEETIEMGLPEEAKDSEGIITTNGTIVYDSEKEDVSITVQAVQEEQNGIVFDAVRTMVTIENEKAPKEYSFKFNLPEKYKMVKDTDYDEGDGALDTNSVYILDENNEIVNTIDPAWAKDANGNDVETYYVINGSELIQRVEFDKDTEFPVVADPTSHPTRTCAYALYKNKVKRIRDAYTNTDASTFLYGVFATIGCLSAQQYALAASTAYLTGVLASMDMKYSQWNKWYNQMDSNSILQVTVVHRWRNAGRNSGYIFGDITFKMYL